MWLLTQDRQKNRARLIEEENARKSSMPTQATLNSSLEWQEKSSEEETKQVLSETVDLEQLMREKAVLEEESRQLDRQLTKLSFRERVLSKKLAEEMDKQNAERCN